MANKDVGGRGRASQGGYSVVPAAVSRTGTARQLDGDNRSGLRIGGDGDGSVMPLDGLAGDGQTQAAAAVGVRP